MLLDGLASRFAAASARMRVLSIQLRVQQWCPARSASLLPAPAVLRMQPCNKVIVPCLLLLAPVADFRIFSICYRVQVWPLRKIYKSDLPDLCIRGLSHLCDALLMRGA